MAQKIEAFRECPKLWVLFGCSRSDTVGKFGGCCVRTHSLMLDFVGFGWNEGGHLQLDGYRIWDASCILRF